MKRQRTLAEVMAAKELNADGVARITGLHRSIVYRALKRSPHHDTVVTLEEKLKLSPGTLKFPKAS